MQNHLKLPKGRICCSLIEQANGKAADIQSIMPIYTKSAIKGRLKMPTVAAGIFRRPKVLFYVLEGNIIDGIDRLAILTYFEMQLDAVGIGITHPRNGLPAFYHFPFFHQQSLVMAVGGQVGRIVLDDNQVAVAAQSVTGIHHFTV